MIRALILSLVFSGVAYGQQAMLLRGSAAAPTDTLFLDLYPGASAAYSVRKLRTAYSGSCMRIRRDSDNAETDIGFSGIAIDQSAITSHCSGANCFVVTWYDQGTNGRNATQSTAADQPKIYDSSTGVSLQNSFPSLSWVSNDRLVIPLALYSASDTDVAYFLNYHLSANGSFPYLIGSAGSVDKGFLANHSTNSRIPRILTVRTGGTSAGNSASALTLGTSYLSYGRADRVNVALDINASNVVNISDSNTDFNLTSVTGFFLGDYTTASGTGDFPGGMSEFIFYNSDVSTSASAIQANINSYFSIY